MLRVLVLYANPVAVSYGAALHRQVVENLRARGHQVDDRDLYAEAFDPVMSERDRTVYITTRPSTGRAFRPRRIACWPRQPKRRPTANRAPHLWESVRGPFGALNFCLSYRARAYSA